MKRARRSSSRGKIATPQLSPCQQCRHKGHSSTVDTARNNNPFGIIAYSCSEGHRWCECSVHDFKVRMIAEDEKITELPRREQNTWCFCAPDEPEDDGESAWVEVKVTARGNYGQRSWEEILPRSLINLYGVWNPTFYFGSLDGKHSEVELKYSELEVDVSSVYDDVGDFETWMKEKSLDHLAARIEGDDDYRRFHAKWTPECDVEALAKECRFLGKKDEEPVAAADCCVWCKGTDRVQRYPNGKFYCWSCTSK